MMVTYRSNQWCALMQCQMVTTKELLLEFYLHTYLNTHISMSNSDLEPEFPHLLGRIAWTASVKQAHEIISDTHNWAYWLLWLDDSEALQLFFHIDAVTNNALPLLQSLESSKELVDLLPRQWLAHGVELCGRLVYNLWETAKTMKNRSEKDVQKWMKHSDLIKYGQGRSYCHSPRVGDHTTNREAWMATKDSQYQLHQRGYGFSPLNHTHWACRDNEGSPQYTQALHEMIQCWASVCSAEQPTSISLPGGSDRRSLNQEFIISLDFFVAMGWESKSGELFYHWGKSTMLSRLSNKDRSFFVANIHWKDRMPYGM